MKQNLRHCHLMHRERIGPTKIGLTSVRKKNKIQQVCVEPPSSSVNMTLYPHLLLSAGACSTAPAAIDRYLLYMPALNSEPAGCR